MWAQATDGTGAAVRIVQLDYKKAFDLIDHRTLANKVLSLHIPRGVARWVIDFLMDRSQRVKLSHDCFLEWGPVRSGVPQGTKLGPWLFVLMINDLRPSDAQTWKYVDDTTLAEVWRAVSDKNTCCRISNTYSKYIQLILGNIQLMDKNISLIVKSILLTTKIYNLLGK